MSTWYARDVKSDILTRVASSSAGINYQIGQINTERTESTPTALSIGSYIFDGQYPRVYLELGNSTIPTIWGMSASDIRETFQLAVTAMILDNSTDIDDHAENYGEAVLRCLQGWYNASATGQNYLCLANSITRDQIDTENQMSLKAITVGFEVRRNQII